MFFTQEDYKKIQQWLVKNSVKDTEFNEAIIPFNGNEIVSIVQGNQNKKVFLKDLVSQIFNLGVSDFVNITDKYDAPNISLEEAIRLIPSRARKEGQVITFLNKEDGWNIYQFKGVLNQWNVLDTWEDLFNWEKLIIDSILPDEEDLTKSLPDENGNSYLSLKDRKYEPENYSGLGRIILRKNIVEVEDPIYGKVKKNILYQDMINKSNTIYEIRYDFDLNGAEITIPEGCVLDFSGGSLSNGSLSSSKLKNKCLNIQNFCIGKDITEALKNCMNLLKEGGIIEIPDGEFYISEDVKIKSNISIKGYGANNTIINTGKYTISNNINGYTPVAKYAYYQYYVNQTIYNNIYNISADAKKGSTTISLDNTDDLNVGDYIYVFNGYCAMWNVLERSISGNRSRLDVLQDNVDLYRTDIYQVVSIHNNTITINSPLTFDLNLIPKTYGLIDDENHRSDEVAWNHPYIEKLNGSNNISIKDLKVISDTDGRGTASIIFGHSLNNIIENVSIENKNGVGLELVSCYNCYINNIEFKNTEKFNLLLSRGSKCNKISNISSTTQRVSMDSIILLMEESNNNTLTNIDLHTKELNVSASIGIYTNTCRNNKISNLYVNGFQSAISDMFSFGGNKFDNVTAYNTNILIQTATAKNGSLSNAALVSYNSDKSSGINFIQENYTNGYIFNNIVCLDNKAVETSFNTSYGVYYYNVKAPYVTFSHNGADSKYLGETPDVSMKNCEWGGLSLVKVSVTADPQRSSIFTECTFNDSVLLSRAVGNKFISCNFLGDIGLNIANSYANDFIDNRFICKQYDIDFYAQNIEPTMGMLNYFKGNNFRIEHCANYRALEYVIDMIKAYGGDVYKLGAVVTLMDSSGSKINLRLSNQSPITWDYEDGFINLTSVERNNLPISSNKSGYFVFDITLNKPIWWIGSKWVDATGADV